MIENEPPLTLEQLSAKVNSLARDQEQIRGALSGDVTGREGAMQCLVRLMQDIYGEKGNKETGMQHRLNSVESNQQKVVWVSLGASIVIGLLWKAFVK